MPWEAKSELDSVSQRAYGRKHTLRLMLSILDSPDGIVSQQYLEETTGISAGTVNKTLSELTGLRMIQRLDAIGTRVISYQIIEGPGWLWAKDLSVGLWPEPRQDATNETHSDADRRGS
jgi:hypothetical protein